MFEIGSLTTLDNVLTTNSKFHIIENNVVIPPETQNIIFDDGDIETTEDGFGIIYE